MVEFEVPEHHATTQNCCSGVRDIPSRELCCGVPRSLFEHSTRCANVHTREQSGSSDKSCGKVCDDVSVQVGQNDYIKLLRFAGHLHARVVHNHTFELDSGVLLCDICAAFKEQSVRRLHDVRLVHSRYLLAPIHHCILERVLCNPRAFLCRNDFERLNHTRDDLVLKARVLAFGVFADYDRVHVFVPRLQAFKIEYMNDVAEQIQLCA
mmetsp:Transcript_575/g.1116  ORF Transcript_575/g.1116 Transcript_575/m.1116 type:complete len:209 (-) Transcript_575:430-1056(-)